MSYSFQQWLLFFYIYCFIGWCFESTYVSFRKRRLVNRGFLHSPLLPIYGSGAVVMLLATIQIREHIVWMFFAGMAGATLLELVVGLAMEAIFKVKYWDYSNQKFNYKGVICLSSSLCWGLFTVLLNRYIHKPVEEFVLGLSQVTVLVIVGVISVIFVCDTVVSVKVALGIRDMLDARARLKKEFGELTEQLSERFESFRDNLSDSLEDRRTEFGRTFAGERLNALAEAINEHLSAISKNAGEWEQDEIRVLSGFKERLKSLKRESESQEKRMSYLKLKMLHRNPTAASRKFKEEFFQMREEQTRWYERRREEKRKKNTP